MEQYSIGRLARFVLACSVLAGCQVAAPASPSPTSPLPWPSRTLSPTAVPSTPTVRPTPTLAPRASPTPTARPLHYVFPLQPPDAAWYGEYHHDYPASDIFAPEGTVFVAVTDGVIDEVSHEDRWDPASDDPSLRGGRFVSIVGDDGVRYYGSHLSAVVPWLEPGMRVAAGQLLGYVGRSGNARDTEPHLHFGLSRPTFPGDWAVRRGEIDPYPYLRAWQEGRDVTPDLAE